MYLATVKHPNAVTVWENIHAKTLTGAKRSATIKYGNYYEGYTIHVVKAGFDENVERLQHHIKKIGPGRTNWKYER